MGVQGFQEFVEKRCPGAVVPVDLLKLARAVGGRGGGGPAYCTTFHPPAGYPHPAGAAPGLAPMVGASPYPHSQHAGGLAPPAPCPARLLVDADSALQRLYGGYQTDWVCGGQWNAMVGYLAALSQACLYQGGLELAVIFNGGLGKERLPEWARKAQAERQTAQLIAGHVGNKGTPPPRAWFLPPACLGHCVRLAMIRFRVKVRFCGNLEYFYCIRIEFCFFCHDHLFWILHLCVNVFLHLDVILSMFRVKYGFFAATIFPSFIQFQSSVFFVAFPDWHF